MKIIQVIQQPQLRGAEIFACQLSNHLIEQGHKVLMVTIFKGDAQVPFSGKIIHLDRPLSMRLFDIKGWKQFDEIIKDFKPDIIQANASDTLKFTTSSKYIFSWKTPIVYRNANKTGDFIDSKLKLGLNKFYVSNLEYVISVSKECEIDWNKTFNYPKEKGITVEIGVEDKQVGDIPGDLIQIFQKGPVLTSIAGFVPEKNHDGLINIFSKTLKKYPDAQLLLVGKGPLKEKIKEKVRKLQIEENVHFLGYRQDVLEILRHSRAFVMPSLIEGLPGVILESMFCRTPVIAYNVGGIGEVVVSGETGWLIEKGSEQDFQDALDTVLRQEKQALPEVVTAHRTIREKFLNDKIARRFVDAYQESLK